METQNQAPHQTWNVGRIIGPKPPLKPKHIWAIRTRLHHEGRIRDLAMFNLAIDSKLRDATSFASVSAMSSLEAPFDSELLLFNRRLGGPYHSNERTQRAKRLLPGSEREVLVKTIGSFRAVVGTVTTSRRVNMAAFRTTGWL